MRAKPRSGSQLERLLTYAARQPVFTPSSAAAFLDIAVQNVYPHLHRLAELNILKQKSEQKLGPVWRADDVLAALDRFAERAGRRG